MQPILPPSEAPPGGGSGGERRRRSSRRRRRSSSSSLRTEAESGSVAALWSGISRHGESPRRPSRGRVELLITGLRCGRALRARAAAGSARRLEGEAPEPLGRRTRRCRLPSAWLGEEGCSRGSQGRRVGGGGGKGAPRLGKQLGSLARRCHWLSRSRGWKKEATRSPRAAAWATCDARSSGSSQQARRSDTRPFAPGCGGGGGGDRGSGAAKRRTCIHDLPSGSAAGAVILEAASEEKKRRGRRNRPELNRGVRP